MQLKPATILEHLTADNVSKLVSVAIVFAIMTMIMGLSIEIEPRIIMICIEANYSAELLADLEQGLKKSSVYTK